MTVRIKFAKYGNLKFLGQIFEPAGNVADGHRAVFLIAGLHEL